MPAANYDLLASNVLGSSTSSVTFSSISADYKDLVLVADVLSASGNSQVYTRVNGDSGSNYYYVDIRGNGSSIQSEYVTAGQNQMYGAQFNTVNTSARGFAMWHFFDYRSSRHKMCLIRANSTGVNGRGTGMVLNRWGSTSAITSITCLLFGDSFAAGSKFYLYGIVG